MNPEDVRQAWADRSGEFSPSYYAHRGPDERSEAVLAAVERHLDRNARVLEVGCSAGRHLAHLHEHGFDRLSGIEINEAAGGVMAETYPELDAAADVRFESLQAALPDLPDRAFDAVYAVETLQHVPPADEWLFGEVARVADHLLVTVEIEAPAPDAEPAEPSVNYVDDDVPLYYRDWRSTLEPHGFEQVGVERLDRDTVRVLRRVDDASGPRA